MVFPLEYFCRLRFHLLATFLFYCSISPKLGAVISYNSYNIVAILSPTIELVHRTAKRRATRDNLITFTIPPSITFFIPHQSYIMPLVPIRTSALTTAILHLIGIHTFATWLVVVDRRRRTRVNGPNSSRVTLAPPRSGDVSPPKRVQCGEPPDLGEDGFDRPRRRSLFLLFAPTTAAIVARQPAPIAKARVRHRLPSGLVTFGGDVLVVGI